MAKGGFRRAVSAKWSRGRTFSKLKAALSRGGQKFLSSKAVRFVGKAKIVAKPYTSTKKAIEKFVDRNDPEFYSKFKNKVNDLHEQHLNDNNPFSRSSPSEEQDAPDDLGFGSQQHEQGGPEYDTSMRDEPSRSSGNGSGRGSGGGIGMEIDEKTFPSSARSSPGDFGKQFSGGYFTTPDSAFQRSLSRSSSKDTLVEQPTSRSSSQQILGESVTLSSDSSSYQQQPKDPTDIDLEIIPVKTPLTQSNVSNQVSMQTKPRSPVEMFHNLQSNKKDQFENDLKALSDKDAIEKLLEQAQSKDAKGQDAKEITAWQTIHYALDPTSTKPGTLGEALAKVKGDLKGLDINPKHYEGESPEAKHFNDLVDALAKERIEEKRAKLNAKRGERPQLRKDLRKIEKDLSLDSDERLTELEKIAERANDAEAQEADLTSAIDAYEKGGANKLDLALEHLKSIEALDLKSLERANKIKGISKLTDPARDLKKIEDYKKFKDAEKSERDLRKLASIAKRIVAPALQKAQEKQAELEKEAAQKPPQTQQITTPLSPTKNSTSPSKTSQPDTPLTPIEKLAKQSREYARGKNISIQQGRYDHFAQITNTTVLAADETHFSVKNPPGRFAICKKADFPGSEDLKPGEQVSLKRSLQNSRSPSASSQNSLTKPSAPTKDRDKAVSSSQR